MPLFEPTSSAPLVLAAERAQRLVEGDPGAAVGDRIFERDERWDPRHGWVPASGLNEALDPLRHLRLEVRCGSCRKRLGFAALHPDHARVVVANALVTGRRRAGFYGLASLTDPNGATEGWARDGERGVGNVKATAAKPGFRTGFPGQPIWTCPECGATPGVTDVTLMRLFLQAIANGQPFFTVT